MDSGEVPPQHRQLQDQRSRKKPVLIVLHQEASTPGHVGRLLAERGHPLDIRRPRYGEPLPQTLAGHAGAVIFGGPMSANDTDDYIKDEIRLVELALKEAAPYLGICLGAQMMAVCMGARVSADRNGHVEIGYHPLQPLRAAAGFAGAKEGFAGANVGPWPRSAYQWHSEGFELPAGAVPLAEGAGPFVNQAFSAGPAALALQFHPEISYGMIARWTGRNEHKLVQPGAQPRPQQLADHVALGLGVRTWLDRLLDAWLQSNCSLQKESSICNFATVGDYI